jgi:hypothetical protein
MGGRGEPGHVNPDLGDQLGGGHGIDAGDISEPVRLCGERADRDPLLLAGAVLHQGMAVAGVRRPGRRPQEPNRDREESDPRARSNNADPTTGSPDHTRLRLTCANDTPTSTSDRSAAAMSISASSKPPVSRTI